MGAGHRYFPVTVASAKPNCALSGPKPDHAKNEQTAVTNSGSVYNFSHREAR